MNMLFNKSAKILLDIFIRTNNPIGLQIMKSTDLTYAYLLKVLKKFESKGLVRSRKRGRSRYFSLTPHGTDLAVRLAKIDLLMNDAKRNA